MLWIYQSFVWYLYLFALGILFFPVVARIFPSFFDRGYPFSKTLGIIITSYILMVLGVLKILPFSREGILFLLVILGFVIHKYSKKQIQDIQKLSLKKKLVLVGEELLFFLCLLFLTFIRGQEPSIRGLEKFMDFGFMMSILRSEYFPPLDMWLSTDPTSPAGYAINYYYFGHLTGAFLIKLVNMIPTVGYNLILSTIFAQAVTQVFSLTANIVYTGMPRLKKKLSRIGIILIGLFGSFLVNLAGNLHTIYLLTRGYPNEQPVPFWTIWQSMKDIVLALPKSNNSLLGALISNSKYWYPNATRFIPFTIHEFPSYSYVVADLHGHVFSLPFVILTLALLYNFIHTVKSHIYDKARVVLHKNTSKYYLFLKKLNLENFEIFMMIGIGGMIAINYMTNAFDGPIYFLLTCFVVFFIFGMSIKSVVLTTLTGISFAVLSLPFSIFFKPFATGVGVNCSPQFLVSMEKFGPFLFEKGNCQISAWWMLFILWGFFLIMFFLYGIYLFLQKRKDVKFMPSTLDLWILVSYAFGIFLITIPELFYIKDIYPAHFRANTMFKMGYQAYIMMSVGSALIFYRVSVWDSRKRYILKVIMAPLIIFVGIYSFIAFPSYYTSLNNIFKAVNEPILDGTGWMARELPQDLDIVRYINNRIDGQPVILEAQGDSYTDFNRVSAYTGTPTVAGWWVHEWLWRGSADIVGSRIPDIEALYQSKDMQYTKELIEKYKIEYVVISEMERTKYKTLNEKKWGKLGVKIFESKNGSGALYKVI